MWILRLFTGVRTSIPEETFGYLKLDRPREWGIISFQVSHWPLYNGGLLPTSATSQTVIWKIAFPVSLADQLCVSVKPKLTVMLNTSHRSSRPNLGLLLPECGYSCFVYHWAHFQQRRHPLPTILPPRTYMWIGSPHVLEQRVPKEKCVGWPDAAVPWMQLQYYKPVGRIIKKGRQAACKKSDGIGTTVFGFLAPGVVGSSQSPQILQLHRW